MRSRAQLSEKMSHAAARERERDGIGPGTAKRRPQVRACVRAKPCVRAVRAVNAVRAVAVAVAVALAVALAVAVALALAVAVAMAVRIGMHKEGHGAADLG